MKKFLFFIIIIIVGFGLWQREPKVREYVNSYLHSFKNNIDKYSQVFYPPCTVPITYSIGTFDTRFGISREYFLSAIAEAESVWEEPFGKEFFVHENESGNLKINLIYDYRQETTDKLDEVNKTVKEDRATYDALNKEFHILKGELDQMNKDYDIKLAEFNKNKENYEKEVAYWNSQGGAPKKEYDMLSAQKVKLDSELRQLEILQNTINKKVNEINAMVNTLNHLAEVLNISVEKYNTINKTLGDTFEGGQYTREGLNTKIDIYEFSNREKLVRILAHELGHALSLEHTADPDSIMYYLNESKNMTLSQDDIDTLKEICKIDKT